MFSITTYFSVEALLLLLVTVLLYACLPQKARRLVLLISSYIFFFSISGKLLIFLLFSTLSVHHIGLWLSDIQNECSASAKGLEREERKALNALYQKSCAELWVLPVFCTSVRFWCLNIRRFSIKISMLF